MLAACLFQPDSEPLLVWSPVGGFPASVRSRVRPRRRSAWQRREQHPRWYLLSSHPQVLEVSLGRTSPLCQKQGPLERPGLALGQRTQGSQVNTRRGAEGTGSEGLPEPCLVPWRLRGVLALPLGSFFLDRNNSSSHHFLSSDRVPDSAKCSLCTSLFVFLITDSTGWVEQCPIHREEVKAQR